MSQINSPLTHEMRNAAHAFTLATGVPTFFIDNRGHRLLPDDRRDPAEAFCSHCQKHQNGECDQVCLYGRYQAERFGGKYIYFCPSGLTYCVSPIQAVDSQVTAVFCGPMLMLDAEEFLLEELFQMQSPEDGSKQSSFIGTETEQMKQRIREWPVIPTERVSALSELLYMLADSLSREGLHKFNSQRDRMETNAAVSVSIHSLKESDQAGNPSSYPLDKERELLSKISIGDKAGAQAILNDILGYVFFSTGSDFNMVRDRAMELVIMLSRGALEGGADTEEIFGLNRRYLDDIHTIKSLEDLTHWLSGILERFTDCVFDLSEIRHRDVIFQAVNYIRRHYTHRISLDEVARHVHLNASYLSRVFKEEMRTNFVTYVNNLRVEAAKKMLLDSAIPLPEVAGLVGFDEQSYFTKVFKKTTGITPGRYREFRGNPANGGNSKHT